MAMAEEGRAFISLEEGLAFLQQMVAKLVGILDGHADQNGFTRSDCMMYYVTVYNMCTQKPPYDYSQDLYGRYSEIIKDYLTSAVLPSLREKHDEMLLRDVVTRWDNHKVMLKWLTQFFGYVDRFYAPRRSLPPLQETGITCFRDLVYQAVKGDVKDAALALVENEHSGEQIDQALLKRVLDMLVEIGLGNMDCYEDDFESPFVMNTRAYYSSLASAWIQECSPEDYKLKVDECIEKERARIAHYLPPSSMEKLLKVVKTELLSTN